MATYVVQFGNVLINLANRYVYDMIVYVPFAKTVSGLRDLGQIQLAGHVTCSNLFMFVSHAIVCRAIHHAVV